jgi:hypothetical protein
VLAKSFLLAVLFLTSVALAGDRDYYVVLGVKRSDDRATIRGAYGKIAQANHPDRHPGDPEAEARFREATEAWEILGDEKERDIYDRFGSYDDNAAATQNQGLISDPRIVAETLKNESTDLRTIFAIFSYILHVKKGDSRYHDALFFALDHPRRLVKKAAVKTFYSLGPGWLAQLLTHADSVVRMEAVRLASPIIVSREPALLRELLTRLVEDEDDEVRIASALALGTSRSSDYNVLTLLIQVGSDNTSAERVRLAAIEAIGKLGSREMRVTDFLLRTLDDPKKIFRRGAVAVLLELKLIEGAIEMRFRNGVKHNSSPGVAESAFALGASGVENFSLCLKNLNHSADRVECAKGFLLYRHHLRPAEQAAYHRNIFIAGLNDEFPAVRMGSIYALQMAVPLRIEAMVGLISFANDSVRDSAERKKALQVLVQIPLDDLLEKLTVAGPGDKVRYLPVVATVASVSPDRAKVSQIKNYIEELTHSPSAKVKEAAIEALGSLSPTVPEASADSDSKSEIKTIIAQLKSENSTDRKKAADRAESVGRADKNLERALVFAVKETRWQFFDAAVAAARALGNREKLEPSSITALDEARKNSKNEKLPAQAFKSLIKILDGEPVRLLIPVMESLSDTTLRSTAVQTLKSMDLEAIEVDAPLALLKQFHDGLFSVLELKGAKYPAASVLIRTSARLILDDLKLGKLESAIRADRSDPAILNYGDLLIAAATRSPGVVPLLEKLAADSNEDIRRAGTKILRKLRGTVLETTKGSGAESEDPLPLALARLKAATSPQASVAAIRDFGVVRRTEVVAALVETLVNRGHETVRVFAAQSLGKIKDKRDLVQTLLAVAKDPIEAPRVRYAAAEAAIDVGCPDLKLMDEVTELFATLKKEFPREQLICADKLLVKPKKK